MFSITAQSTDVLGLMFISVCATTRQITALVNMCVWMYREEEECSGQSSAYIFPDVEAELL